MFRYQYPFVMKRLAEDCVDYGFCHYRIVDTHDMFIIERLHPYYE